MMHFYFKAVFIHADSIFSPVLKCLADYGDNERKCQYSHVQCHCVQAGPVCEILLPLDYIDVE